MWCATAGCYIKAAPSQTAVRPCNPLLHHHPNHILPSEAVQTPYGFRRGARASIPVHKAHSSNRSLWRRFDEQPLLNRASPPHRFHRHRLLFWLHKLNMVAFGHASVAILKRQVGFSKRHHNSHRMSGRPMPYRAVISPPTFEYGKVRTPPCTVAYFPIAFLQAIVNRRDPVCAKSSWK
jgi:hypothetical protein